MAAKQHEWETVIGLEGDVTERMAVPGGWLYMRTTSPNGPAVSTAMCFVPNAVTVSSDITITKKD